MPLPSDSPTREKPGDPSQNIRQQTGKHWRWLDDILAPLKVPDFRLLFAGQMVSTTGDMFYAVALPWLLLSTGHTPQELGIVLAAYGVPRVCTLLLGGVLSDRFQPRRVMLLSDVMRALLVGLMAVFVVLGDTEVWRLSIVAAMLGAFTGLFLPAYYAMAPEILPADALQAGNALSTSTIQLALFIGSGLAGAVVSRFDPGIALFVDACTFVVSAITLLLMRGDRRPFASSSAGDGKIALVSSPEAAEDKPGFAADITFWQLLRTWRLLQVALLVVAFGNFLFNGMFEVALPTLAHDQLAAGASGYGLLMAAFGAGSLLGGLSAGLLGRIAHRGMLLLFLIMALACWYSFVPFAGGLPGAILLIGCAGLTNGLLTVFAFTILQQQAPRHLMGRLMAVLIFASLGLYPFSVALAGLLTTHFGPVLLFPLSGAMMLVAAIFGWLQRDVRSL